MEENLQPNHPSNNSVSKSSYVYLTKAFFAVLPTKTLFFLIVQERKLFSLGVGSWDWSEKGSLC